MSGVEVGRKIRRGKEFILFLSFIEDGVVIRGCWNDAAEEHKNYCAAEDAPCHHCIGEGCNNSDHSGSVNLIVALPLIVLSAMVTLLIQL